MTIIKAADLKRGDGVIFRGERQVVEAVRRDPQNTKVVDLHFFGVVRWFAVSPNLQIESAR